MTSGPFPEQLTYTKHEVVSLKGHTQFNEKWVQEQIAEEPQILGLGELRLVATEKPIPGGGRLDLLLIDDEGNRRYEMELMLGAVDESHIIRTLEYWDVERRRFPHYDHCAVIVAEEITSRFINVIQLFNRTVPLIAIQMKALKVDSQILLTFTKVLDEFEIGPTEDEEPEQPADRAYWEKLGSVATLKLTDRCLELVHEIEPGASLRYNRHFIGLTVNNRPAHFVRFRPKKRWLEVTARTTDKEKAEREIEEVGFVLLHYSRDKARVRFQIHTNEFSEHLPLLRRLFERAHVAYGLGGPRDAAAETEVQHDD